MDTHPYIYVTAKARNRPILEMAGQFAKWPMLAGQSPKFGQFAKCLASIGQSPKKEVMSRLKVD